MDWLLLILPQTKGMPDASHIVEQGRQILASGSLPLASVSLATPWAKFQDALRMRYALLPNNFPCECD